MPDTPAYEVDPYRTSLETEVVAAGAEEGRPFVLLADSVLYPEGGGQPADRGSIGGVPVLDVQRRGGEVRHYVERAVPPGPAAVSLDWARRFDHMQHHTGQHLLSAVAEDRFGWRTTSFHLHGDLCDVELDAPRLGAIDLERLSEAVAAEVRAARPVRVRLVAPEEVASGALRVRTRGLPEGLEGPVRLVEIEGVDLNTCGGTHLRSTAEIEGVHLVRTEPMRGGTRLFFVAGGRARRRFAALEARGTELRALLNAPDAELASALRARLDAARDGEKREQALARELAGAAAAGLAARPEALVEAHWEERGMPFLQQVARALVGAAPGRTALLTSGSGESGVFVLASGAASGADVRGLGAEVAALLGGRGGGDARVFQGKAPDLARRAEALARLRQVLAPVTPPGEA